MIILKLKRLQSPSKRFLKSPARREENKKRRAKNVVVEKNIAKESSVQSGGVCFISEETRFFPDVRVFSYDILVSLFCRSEKKRDNNNNNKKGEPLCY
jgi:hypothetical protein